MNNFKDKDNRGGGGFRGGTGGGRPSYPKKSWGGDRAPDSRGGDKPMFQATCSKCQKTCEVPFRPNGSKPVYCRDCFNVQRDAGDSRGGSRSDFNSRGPKRDFGDRPSFRNDTRSSFKPQVGGNDDTKKQLSEISIKLDRLIDVVEKMNSMERGVKESAPVHAGALVAVSVKTEDGPRVSKKKMTGKNKK